MAKRRIILNEDQLPDFGGGGIKSKFYQQLLSTFEASYSKLTGALTNDFIYTSILEPTQITGSSIFNMESECDNLSKFKIRFQCYVQSDQIDTTGRVKFRLGFGSSLFGNIGTGIPIYTSSGIWLLETELYIEFYKTTTPSIGGNRFLINGKTIRFYEDLNTNLSGNFINYSLGNNYLNEPSITGDQQLILEIAGIGVSQCYIGTIYCEKIT